MTVSAEKSRKSLTVAVGLKERPLSICQMAHQDDSSGSLEYQELEGAIWAGSVEPWQDFLQVSRVHSQQQLMSSK